MRQVSTLATTAQVKRNEVTSKIANEGQSADAKAADSDGETVHLASGLACILSAIQSITSQPISIFCRSPLLAPHVRLTLTSTSTRRLIFDFPHDQRRISQPQDSLGRTVSHTQKAQLSQGRDGHDGRA